MLPSDSRSLRPERRARRRTSLAAPERLESRELMAFSPLGFSLPDLSITGSAGTARRLGRDARRHRHGAQHGDQHDHQPDRAGARERHHGRRPRVDGRRRDHPARRIRGRAVTIGTFQAPPVPQNSLEQIAESFTLPARPAGFAGGGGKFFVHLIVNSNSKILEANKIE